MLSDPDSPLPHDNMLPPDLGMVFFFEGGHLGGGGGGQKIIVFFSGTFTKYLLTRVLLYFLPKHLSCIHPDDYKRQQINFVNYFFYNPSCDICFMLISL